LSEGPYGHQRDAGGPAGPGRRNETVPPPADPDTSAGRPGADDAAELAAGLAAELTAAQRERDEYLDALQRLKAEFDNYRKRVAREQDTVRLRASERLITQLVPLLDDLERALEAAVEHGELKLAEGVSLVHRSLASLLAREGLQEVATDGAFDPHTQEALLSQPSEEAEGTVVQVLQKGYRLGDHVLRPARVVVSSGTPVPPGGESG
jgi:molecular chaperone GrpE